MQRQVRRFAASRRQSIALSCRDSGGRAHADERARLMIMPDVASSPGVALPSEATMGHAAN
jgi:hypothetical protein